MHCDKLPCQKSKSYLNSISCYSESKSVNKHKNAAVVFLRSGLSLHYHPPHYI